MQADQLIKGDELNCMRPKRYVALLSLRNNCSYLSFSATIDRFLTWLAEATNAGLRQMYAEFFIDVSRLISSAGLQL